MPCALQYALCEVSPGPDSGRVAQAPLTPWLPSRRTASRALLPDRSISSLPHSSGRGPSHIT